MHPRAPRHHTARENQADRGDRTGLGRTGPEDDDLTDCRDMGTPRALGRDPERDSVSAADEPWECAVILDDDNGPTPPVSAGSMREPGPDLDLDPSPGADHAPGPTPPARARARAEFDQFFDQHHRDLARFAYLLIGDHDAADDLAADALTAAWRHWDRVRAADSPLAYVRRSVANLAASRVRRTVRERRGLTALGALPDRPRGDPDVPAIVDLRSALLRLPDRKRACVVLRYGFDLSEQETAQVLGIAVGTVKSQTSKAVSELEQLLAGSVSGTAETQPATAAPARAGGRAAGRQPSRQNPRTVGRASTRSPLGRAAAPTETARSAFRRLQGGEA
jgi:RNA polymerase sigma-70 factor (sigma-E family)